MLRVLFSLVITFAVSPTLAAQNNGGGPNVINIGLLQSQGYVCIKTDNFQTMCMKGGSIYICPDSVTCIETAKKQIDLGNIRAPVTGLRKSATQP